MSKPISVRFSDAITGVIQAIATKENKTPSDVIREAVEEKSASANGFLSEVVAVRMKATDLIEKIRSEIQKKRRKDLTGRRLLDAQATLDLPEYAVILDLIHAGYQQNDGFASPRYFAVVADILCDLLILSHASGVTFHAEGIFNRLGMNCGLSDFTSKFCREFFEGLKKDFSYDPGSAWPEVVASSNLRISSSLDAFRPEDISHVISWKRLEAIFPLLVLGANAQVTEFQIHLDLEELLPEPIKIKIANTELILTICPGSMSVLVSGLNHCFVYGPKALLSLIAYFEHLSIHPGQNLSTYGRQALQILANDDSCIFASDGSAYRLFISMQSFEVFKDELLREINSRGWKWLLGRTRELIGDY